MTGSGEPPGETRSVAKFAVGDVVRRTGTGPLFHKGDVLEVISVDSYLDEEGLVACRRRGDGAEGWSSASMIELVDRQATHSVPEAPEPDPEYHAHVVLRRDRDGTTHVQHFGEAYVVRGSESVVDLPVGTTVVVRMLKAETGRSC